MTLKPATIIWELLSRLAYSALAIRISGETSIGKESIARLLGGHYPHQNSIFAKFNCNNFKLQSKAPSLRTPAAESVEAFLRVLEAPHYHVLYLEDIDRLPDDLQGRLLGLFEKHHPPAPPWVITSSVEPLENYVRTAGFSAALLKALDTVHIALPPLRAQSEENPGLLDRLLRQNNDEDRCGRPSIPEMDTLERLIHYHWPTSWKQLKHVTRSAFNANGWESALNSFDLSKDQDETHINEMAAIYILSLAKLDIRKDRVMEGLMTAANLDEIGLLDLAIFHEAVNQIAERIGGQDPGREE